MDIDNLRTFLEVCRTRHFGHASRHLFVTQSAISSRIRLLEEELGAELFTRARNNIQLTKAGKKLQKFAESIVLDWEEAKQRIALEEKEQIVLSVGSISTLWDILLQTWIQRMMTAMSNLAFRGETLNSESLIRGLLARIIDVGFIFEPPQIAELLSQEVAVIELVMVSTKQGESALEATKNGYVMVDWGTAFSINHARWFPDIPIPQLQLDLGRLVVDMLLKKGGAAYLAKPMIQGLIKQKKIFVVEDAPVFNRFAYAVYSNKNENIPIIEKSLEYVKNI